MRAIVTVASLLLFGVALAQEAVRELVPGNAYDVELDTSEGGTTGLTRSFRLVVAEAGRLYVHLSSSDFDAVLRIEDARGAVSAKDDDSGGGQDASTQLELDGPAELTVHVAAKSPEASGRATLYVYLARDTEESIEAANEAHLLLRELIDYPESAHEACGAALEILDEADPGTTSPAASEAHWQVGMAAIDRALYDHAANALARSCAFRERVLSPGHPDLSVARDALAVALINAERAAEALPLLQGLVEVYGRQHPRDGYLLLQARQNLANVLRMTGDLEVARAHQEEVVEIRSRALAPDNPGLLNGRINLAVVLQDLGDVAAARSILEDVVELHSKNVEESDEILLAARKNLARARRQMGDDAGARAEYELILSVEEGLLAADDPALLATRHELGVALLELGELEAARAHFEGVLAELPPEMPLSIRARSNLAFSFQLRGECGAALEQQLEILRLQAATGVSKTHSDRLGARQNLAYTRFAMGDGGEARTILEEVLARRLESLPDDDPLVQAVRMDLLLVLSSLGDHAAIEVQIDALAAGLRTWARASLGLSAREARGRTRLGRKVLSALLSLEPRGDEDLSRELFALIETVRAVSTGEVRVPPESLTDELRDLRAEARELRQRVNALAHGSDHDRARLTEAVFARDRAEGDLWSRLVEAGWSAPEIDAASLAKAVGDAAIVTYLVYERPSPGQPVEGEGRHSLVAHVLSPDGSLGRIELGPLQPVRDAVTSWRTAIGQSPGRGDPVPSARPRRDARVAGEALRALVLDPILERVGRRSEGAVPELFVVADGPLHLVPFDILPLDDGVVGDHLRIRHEVSLARLLRKRTEPTGKPRLVLLGGIDFDATPGAPAPSTADRARSGSFGGGLPPLPGSRAEVDALASIFRRRFEVEPELLSGGAATKAAFLARSPGARFLHLATHGLFSESGDLGRGELVPLVHCGLALAGANQEAGATGRVDGVLTGEELAGLDLTGCELAVLSACDTNVGTTDEALGLSSLQSALHAAGVRTAVTSLWKVPDDATRELMLAFYRLHWIEGRSPGDALWGAKQVLREKGEPPRAWGAWMLTGASR